MPPGRFLVEGIATGRSAIDSAQDANLVVNALGMAVEARRPAAGGIVRADHGTQVTSRAFTHKIRASGLMPSFGKVGDCYDFDNRQRCHSTLGYITAIERELRFDKTPTPA
jgi:putative transposase